MQSIVDQVLTHAATAATGGVGAWALLRGKRVEASAETTAAEIAAAPTWAQQLAVALDRLDEERRHVARLTVELAAVTKERDVLSDQVAALSARLDETSLRLGELNDVVRRIAVQADQHIPAQRTTTTTTTTS